MGIKDFLNKRIERKDRIREMEEETRISQAVEQKMKSPEERELEDFMKRERQKQIKMKLQEYRDREKGSMLKGNLMDNHNIFKGHKNILQADNLFQFKGDYFQ